MRVDGSVREGVPGDGSRRGFLSKLERVGARDRAGCRGSGRRRERERERERVTTVSALSFRRKDRWGIKGRGRKYGFISGQGGSKEALRGTQAAVQRGAPGARASVPSLGVALVQDLVVLGGLPPPPPPPPPMSTLAAARGIVRGGSDDERSLTEPVSGLMGTTIDGDNH